MKQENTADNNNYITSATGNSEFCFPETLNVSQGGDEGNIEVKGKQNSLFPAEPVIKCFVLLPNSKLDKTAKKSFALRQLAHKICCSSKENDLITCESKVHVTVSLWS